MLICDYTETNTCKYSEQNVIAEGTYYSPAERHIQKQKDYLSSFEEQNRLDDHYPMFSAYSWIQGIGQNLVYDKYLYRYPSLSFIGIKDQTDVLKNNDIYIEVGTSIKEMAEENSTFNKIVNVMSSYLEQLLNEYKMKSKIDIKLDKDIEFPDWEEIVINVKIANLENSKLLEVWDLIESKLRVRTDSILENNTDKEKYGNYIIVVNHLNDGTDL